MSSRKKGGPSTFIVLKCGENDQLSVVDSTPATYEDAVFTATEENEAHGVLNEYFIVAELKARTSAYMGDYYSLPVIQESK